MRYLNIYAEVTQVTQPFVLQNIKRPDERLDIYLSLPLNTVQEGSREQADFRPKNALIFQGEGSAPLAPLGTLTWANGRAPRRESPI